MNRRDVVPGLLASACLPAVLLAAQPAPYGEVLNKIRSMAASCLGRKYAEVSTMDSLFRQGMTEKQFDALIIDIQDEFSVLLPANEIHEARWNDAVVGLSVRRLADMVTRKMRDNAPW